MNMNDKRKRFEGAVAPFLAALKGEGAPWAVVALAALLLLTSACAVDTERLSRGRDDLRQVCQGAMTAYLRSVCDRAGVDRASETTPR